MKIKPWVYKLASMMSVFAVTYAFGGTGNHCRTWLYQPKTPKKLMED